MADLIQLSRLEPLAKGHSRLVFQHPFRDDCLIKVIRPDVAERRFGGGTSWYKRRRRYGRYLSYVREIQEYIVGWAGHGRELPFMQAVIGLETTDLGLGLVMKAAHDKNGRLAPNLAELILAGRFDAAVRADLDAFVTQLLDSDVIISDLNARNLVHAHDGRDGTDRFVLIDGIGNSNPIPFKAMARWINRRSKQGRVRRLYRKIDFLLAKAGRMAAGNGDC